MDTSLDFHKRFTRQWYANQIKLTHKLRLAYFTRRSDFSNIFTDINIILLYLLLSHHNTPKKKEPMPVLFSLLYDIGVL